MITLSNPIPVDISQVLKSTIALGFYRGEEVCSEIVSEINKAEVDSLLVVDLSQVVWIDTAFCKPAFGPIVSDIQGHKWPRKHIIFRMRRFQKPGFFQGVLKRLDCDVPRKDAESCFVSKGNLVKTMNEDNIIEFHGRPSSSEFLVLVEINGMSIATFDDLRNKSDLTPETLVDSLRALLEKDFITKISCEGQEYYCSLYKYFKDEGMENNAT